MYENNHKLERIYMNSKVTPLLSDLSNMPIDRFQIDTKNDTIKLNFTENSNKIDEIVFNEVTSFYYLDHDLEEDTENTSLNNIMYCGMQSTDLIDTEDENVAVSIPNFVLEFNDSNIFIEANSIVINNQEFVV